MPTPKRTLYRVRTDSPTAPKCRCGLLRAYIAHITVKKPNRHGLLADVTMMRSFCTTHGKQYAAKHKLEVQPMRECTRCGGAGVISGAVSDEQAARGVVHRTVACPACHDGAIT